jgi:hypothetical protein
LLKFRLIAVGYVLLRLNLGGLILRPPHDSGSEKTHTNACRLAEPRRANLTASYSIGNHCFSFNRAVEIRGRAGHYSGHPLDYLRASVYAYHYLS